MGKCTWVQVSVETRSIRCPCIWSYRKLWVAQCECWEPSLGPLQYMLSTFLLSLPLTLLYLPSPPYTHPLVPFIYLEGQKVIGLLNKWQKSSFFVSRAFQTFLKMVVLFPFLYRIGGLGSPDLDGTCWAGKEMVLQYAADRRKPWPNCYLSPCDGCRWRLTSSCGLSRARLTHPCSVLLETHTEGEWEDVFGLLGFKDLTQEILASVAG